MLCIVTQVLKKKIADAIMDEATKDGIEDLIEEVSVPTQAVVEVRRGVTLCLTPFVQNCPICGIWAPIPKLDADAMFQ
jgi:transcription antitermination factor NusG